MARIRKDQPRYERTVFSRVWEQYEEIKATNGSNNSLGLYRARAGKRNYNPRIIRPTFTDLVSDIELSVRRALSGPEQALFIRYHINKNRPKPTVEVKEKLDKIEQKIGRVFIARRIHPIEVYLRPKDLR